ncbi:hypothetical protein BV898_17202 [Hypsibius exemplaris]|uniref:Uncharacterized protein n=1 Tax=Hypsibius exemplaris TaxID=2072580 RepID=A0A9X6RLX1_HYPEX|nr:hypothetical protein BV898_17202 [Hypsibius exemplaris]
MSDDIVFVQSFLLGANDAPPASTKETVPTRWYRYKCLRNYFRIAFIGASLGLAVADFVDVITFSLGASGDTGDAAQPFVISLGQLLWRSFFAARGVTVLVLFSYRLPQWRALRAFALNKTRLQLNLCNAKVLTSFRHLSMLLFVISFSAHVSTMALFWLSLEGFLDGPINWGGNISGAAVLENSTSCYYMWFDRCVGRNTYVPLWTLLIDCPFILSQQVLISGLIFVWLAVKAMRSLRKEVAIEKVNLTVAWSDTGSNLLPDMIRNWTLTYVNMARFVEYFNELFGRILLVSVGLDVMTVLGVCARIIAVPERTEAFPLKNLRYGWDAVLFLAYATICYMPCIILHEESRKLNGTLRDFVWTAHGFGEQTIQANKEPSSKDASAVLKQIMTFSRIVEKSPLTIEVGGLFNFSRTSLVTILTSVVTTLLLTKEILKRSDTT